MARVKRTPKVTATGVRASPVWYALPHSLAKERRTEICSLLGFDCETKADEARLHKAITRIELLLGGYPGAVSALDNAPRAADYRARLSPLASEAAALLRRTTSLDTWMRDAVELELKAAHQVDPIAPTNLYAIETALAAITHAAAGAAKRYVEDDSRGAPARVALRDLIAQLRQVFQEARGIDRSERLRVGAQSDLTEYENDEVDFLRVALDDAGIPHPRNLRSLFAEIGADRGFKKGGARR